MNEKRSHQSDDQHALSKQAEVERDPFFVLALDMLCIASADGYFKRVNPAFTHTLGWSIEEMLARPFLEFVHPDDRTATLREVEKQVIAGENVLHFENRYLHKDGSWRLLSWKSVPQPGGLLFATARDITELRQLEEQMTKDIETLAEFKAALDEHAIVAITDARGKITYVNDKFCTISKYAREELIGQDHRIVNSGYHPKAFIRELWQTIASGRVWKGEIKNQAKDGSFYWVDTTIIPFLDEHGKPYQHIAIRADITEQKSGEERILQLNTDLRRHAAQLEAATVHARQMAKRAEEANASKSEFLAGMSHELRTPMNGVLGMLGLLTDTPLAPVQQEYVDTAQKSAEDLLVIINDILDFSKIEAGKMTIEPQPFNLQIMLEDLEIP